MATTRDTESGEIQCQYDLKVDPLQDDKATELKICSFTQPHMRSFHLAWIGFFMAFLAWFSFAPLMPEIKKDIGLTKPQIWTANICSVTSTIFFRFLVGPLCDKIGGRVCLASILLVGSIPVFLGGFVVNSAADLAIVRFVIGVIGAAFVPCQYWTQANFAKEVAGTAQAFTGGWGNLGGGVTQFFMVAAYIIVGEQWRVAFIIPAILVAVIGALIFFAGQDCPKGRYTDLQKAGQMTTKSPLQVMAQAASHIDTWLLFIQYATCFGIELTINNFAVSYYVDEFGQPLAIASLVGSLFGLMNLFARALGGIVSDFANKNLHDLNKSHSLRARIVTHCSILLYEGLMLIAFSRTTTFGAAVGVMVLFSIGVQCAEGTTFSLVPYVDPPVTGAVSGIVGAGGNTGAMMWGFLFLFGGHTDRDTLMILGIIVMLSALVGVLFQFPKFKDADVEKIKATEMGVTTSQESKTAVAS
uniref:Major facilitator superfamily (MFS) profile domain-containing protein n=1 Tax=Fibrocapsa japonica TaxID=94617 RepID=A0A7S2V099_9STRA|mmetsp:Transcript_22939/g.33270  ORF Transcript_22939/g.33270 Transcript_22939/m.33270 type:complete len:471 (+) Transcript_22939:71-1483(+)|eukprot:CAMPEP_0113936098 /NCGR_PEP_ID=MMETSP1339-20121228/3072_1 /TAXON_ID=94617 /ORGANISM="Fibrocapsa japonica" /LENGTH=470 /DNA_ID=CAMNT_0000938439 /DNA_START=69 /DNA_END=1481 /DNA_ORIENTATION=+ /assembly_acc=CAM_ASM_000762